jgi:PAS domain S-box-containing protein
MGEINPSKADLFAEVARLRAILEKNHLDQDVVNSGPATSGPRLEHHSILENLNVGVFRTTCELQGSFIFGNPALAGMFGYDSLEEFLSLPTVGLYHSREDRESFLRDIQRTGWVRNRVVRMRRRDGEVFWASLSVRGHRDSNGNLAWLDGVIEDISERRRTEEALRETERRYRELYENLPDGFVVVDSQGAITHFNPAFLELLGYDRHELLGKELLKLTPVKWRAFEMAILEQQVVVRGYSDMYEKEFICKDGTPIPVELRTFVSLDEDGQLAGFWAFVRDITERKISEVALARSEERYRTIFNEVSDAMILFDEDGRVVDANQAALDLYGYSFQELASLRGAELMAEGHEADLDGPTPQVVERGQVRLQSRTRRRDGTLADVEIKSVVITVRGRPHLLALVRDITQERLLQAQRRELDQTRELFEAVFKEHPHPLLLCQYKSGSVLAVNRAFEEQWFYEPGQVEGKASESLYADPHDRKQLISLLDRKGRVVAYRCYRLKGDGSKAPALLSMAPVKVHGEDLVIVTANDVTDQERLEEQLRQAQKMEAVGTLAGGVAHDFNNILQAISGYVDLLWKVDSLNSQGEHCLRQMEVAAGRARDLVRQLLTFSRRLEPEMKPVDLNQEVGRAVKLLERTIPKMIFIITDIAPDLRPVYGDPAKLEQVLVNLGTNARDAMPTGGRLVITTANAELDAALCREHPELKPGSYVLLTVSDNGQGMDPETQRHIFEPFFTTKGVGEGTGLGLSTAYGIVKAHGGHIFCNSTISKGAEFRVYLPAMEGAMPDLYYETREPEVGSVVENGTQTILLVDDEAAIIDTLGEMLSLHGFQVMKAFSGEEALGVYKKQGRYIDLVILDIGMPGMGGRACLRQLKEINPAVKVIIASGYAADTEDARDLKSQASGYMVKPYRMQDLLETLEQVMGQATA